MQLRRTTGKSAAYHALLDKACDQFGEERDDVKAQTHGILNNPPANRR
jgi:hypothetical protein